MMKRGYSDHKNSDIIIGNIIVISPHIFTCFAFFLIFFQVIASFVFAPDKLPSNSFAELIYTAYSNPPEN